MDQTLVSFGLMIIVGAVVALLAKRFRQPVLLGYVLAGLLIGPAALGWVPNTDIISFISDIGLIFLMFIIGLELDLSKLKDVGKTSVMIGTIQVVVVTLVAALASLLLRFTFIQGLYLGLVISFSSTLVVVKMLTDIHEIDSLHGELALGILVIQDVLAVVGLSILGSLGAGGATHSNWVFFGIIQNLTGLQLPSIVTLFANLFLFALVTYLFGKYIMPIAFKEAVTSTELLFVVTLAVVFILSEIAGFFEFSLAMGAFLAGIALSTAAYSHDIIGRVKPLKDFFLILFFVGLGMQIAFQNFVSQFLVILFIAVGALVLKPVVTFFTLKLFKYNNRTSFLVSVHLAQVGEFGMVLIASGAAAFAGSPVITGVVIITIVTMTLTAYVIKYDEELYGFAKPFIAPFDDIFGTRPEEHRNMPDKYQPEVIIMGVNSMTAEAIEMLHKRKRILVIDYNPAKILSYRERGIPTICSDAVNPDLYDEIDFRKVQSMVSVVHQHNSNALVIKKMHEINKQQGTRINIIVSASTEDWGKKLYRAGATLVLIPDVIGRRMLTEILSTDDPATVRNIGRVYHEELHKNFVYIREI